MDGGFDVIDRLSPNIRVAMDHHTEHPFVLKPRVIFDYELLYMSEGSLLVTIEDESFAVEQGEMLLIKPGSNHSFKSVSPGHLHMPHLHFDLLHYEDFHKLYTSFKPIEGLVSDDIKLIRPDLLGREKLFLPNHIRLSKSTDAPRILTDIINVHKNKAFLYKLKEKELFLRLIYCILFDIEMQSDASAGKNAHRLEKVRKHILDNLDKKLTLEELSKLCCLSTCHLERLFKKLHGISILQYQTERRMDAAKEMMLYTDLSISEIAGRVGYSTIHTFSKAFKKATGISPREYINTSYIGQSAERARTDK